MMAKIEWYKEILEIEPGSKLFFPYARELVEVGQNQLAVQVLRQGLAMHPEFIEARVLLVSLLYEAQDTVGCSAEMEPLFKMFSAYPAFWDAWSQMASKHGKSAAALGSALLASVYKNESVSLESLMLSALQLSTGHNAPAHEEAKAPRSSASEKSKKPRKQAEEHAGKSRAESFSLRTRSMADVLAEQGDLESAIAIYNELIANSTTVSERRSLRRRLKDMEKKLEAEKMLSASDADMGQEQSKVIDHDSTAQSEADTAASAAPNPHQMQDNHRMVLENLAKRLEARARD